MTLRGRLVLALSLSLAALFAAVGGGLYAFFSAREEAAVDDGLRRTAAEVLRSVRIEEPLFFPWQEVVLPDVDVFTFPNTLLEILSPDGRVVARSSALQGVRLPLPAPVFEAALAGRTVTATAAVRGHRVRLLAAPLVARGQAVGVLVVASTLDPLERTLANLRLVLGGSLVFLVALAALVTSAVTRRELRPLEALVATVADIESGRDLSRRVPKGGAPAELGRLIDQLNAMLGRLEAAYEALAAALKAQQRFVADASHELRTPLTAMRGNLELLERMLAAGTPVSDVRDVVRDLRDDVERMIALAERLLALARADADRREAMEPFAVGPWLAALIERLRRRYGAGKPAVAVEFDCPAAGVAPGAEAEASARTADGLFLPESEGAAGRLRGRPDALASAVELLLENALKYTDRGRVRIVCRAADGRLVFRVEDTGIGISPDDVPHVFERFYRGKNALDRPGTGLGLAIVRAVARAHGGDVTIESAPGQGTAVTLMLPLDEAGPPPEAPSETAPKGPPGRHGRDPT
ncbi:sensor histidine kinase [Hydrogenibacillus schlegelii]|uniref:sensor histidine kinase n=1 Tax=Hydrogenibacillus schlegelii TaxID=1484 RepID=UPI0039EAB98D